LAATTAASCTFFSQALLVQLLDPSNRADPYPAYEQIRERGPLLMPDAHLTVFSSFTDCDDVLRHPSSASDRLRKLVSKAFVPKVVKAL
jgi:cytochrome P450